MGAYLATLCGGRDECTRSCDNIDFGFGYDNPAYANRVLRILIGDECKQSLHVDSLVLAARSYFFKRLFTEEANPGEVMLQVNTNREAEGVQELLKYLYSGFALKTTELNQIMNLLIAADNFDVKPCVESCVNELMKSTITVEFAISAFDLLPQCDKVKELQTKVENLLVEQLRKNLLTYEVPLTVMEYLVKTPRYHEFREYDAYTDIRSWVNQTYTNEKQRINVLDKLIPHVNFSVMTKPQLRSISEDVDLYDCKPYVMEALLSTDGLRRFTWNIPNFSKRAAENIVSPTFTTSGGHNWCISVILKAGENRDHLSVFLRVPKDNCLPNNWKTNAIFTFALINQKELANSLVRKSLLKEFDNKNSWGYTKFVSMETVEDEIQGYLVNDTLVIAADVVVHD